eukprot:3590222-Pyramimonas_sp.AAC.1
MQTRALGAPGERGRTPYITHAAKQCYVSFRGVAANHKPYINHAANHRFASVRWKCCKSTSFT